MIMNDVLKAIKNRRTIRRFRPNPIDAEMLQMILEAGRWAPSFSNLQPWKFIVVQDQGLKNALDKAARESVLHLGLNEAPVVILVCVDRRIDPLHAIEAGAAATQNMTLAANSLGLEGWLDWDLGNGNGNRNPKTLRITRNGSSCLPGPAWYPRRNSGRTPEADRGIYTISVKIPTLDPPWTGTVILHHFFKESE